MPHSRRIPLLLLCLLLCCWPHGALPLTHIIFAIACAAGILRQDRRRSWCMLTPLLLLLLAVAMQLLRCQGLVV
jgi:hypothetical protein